MATKADHPGKILERKLRQLFGDRARVEGAKRMHVSAQRLAYVLDEHGGISDEMAIRIARVTGTEAQYWADLQTAYYLPRLSVRMARELKVIDALREAAEA
jgi:addiction module HigA family antidote